MQAFQHFLELSAAGLRQRRTVLCVIFDLSAVAGEEFLEILVRPAHAVQPLLIDFPTLDFAFQFLENQIGRFLRGFEIGIVSRRRGIAAAATVAWFFILRSTFATASTRIFCARTGLISSR